MEIVALMEGETQDDSTWDDSWDQEDWSEEYGQEGWPGQEDWSWGDSWTSGWDDNEDGWNWDDEESWDETSWPEQAGTTSFNEAVSQLTAVTNHFLGAIQSGTSQDGPTLQKPPTVAQSPSTSTVSAPARKPGQTLASITLAKPMNLPMPSSTSTKTVSWKDPTNFHAVIPNWLCKDFVDHNLGVVSSLSNRTFDAE